MNGFQFIPEAAQGGISVMTLALVACAIISALAAVMLSIRTGERFYLIVGLIAAAFFGMVSPIPSMNASVAARFAAKDDVIVAMEEFYGVKANEIKPGKVIATSPIDPVTTELTLKDGRACIMSGKMNFYTLYCDQGDGGQKLEMTPAPAP